MARNQETIVCENGAWTQLTNADVTSITFQVLLGDVYLRFTTDQTQPSEAQGMLFSQWSGVTKKPLSELTSLSGAARVWAKPVSGNGAVVDTAAVYVDHG
jgi:hypothetical protein